MGNDIRFAPLVPFCYSVRVMASRPFKRIAQFLFEVGTLRRLPRIHRQTLLVEDTSDTIASHSFRVALIGWQLAKLEKVDPYKVVMMCLLHDLGEARSNDHNWVHKRYIKIFEDEITKDQLGTLPDQEPHELVKEYTLRKSKESIVAKDADLIDQVLLLREYEHQGNKEASLWLTDKGHGGKYAKLSDMKTKSAKEIGKAIYHESPSSWRSAVWQKHNR